MGGGAGHDIAGSEGKAGHVVGTKGEGTEDGLLIDGKNLGREELSIVENHLNVHFVLEGSDLQLIEESGLGSSNLLSVGDNLDGVDDLDLSLNNLGGNGQSLEERGLLGIEAGGSGGDDDIGGSEGSNSGGGLSDLGVEDGLDVEEVTVGENDAGVEDELVRDQFEVGPRFVSSHGFLVILGAQLSLIGCLVEVGEGSLHEGL